MQQIEIVLLTHQERVREIMKLAEQQRSLRAIRKEQSGPYRSLIRVITGWMRDRFHKNGKLGHRFNVRDNPSNNSCHANEAHPR